MAIWYQSVGDLLEFDETISHNQHVITITDTMVFTENEEDRINDFDIIQSLLFSSQVHYTLSGHRSISQTLTFTDRAARTQVGQISQNLTFTQTVDPGNKWPLVNQVLVFHETIVGQVAYGTYDTLAFTETIGLSFIRAQHISQTLGFSDNAVAYKPTPSYIAPGTVPTIVPNKFVTFAYYNLSVTLRTPEFDNSDEFKARRIQRETRGGDLIIYRDPTWSTDEVFELNWTYISETDARQMELFINATVGLPITYTDHEGNAWIGIVTNPELATRTPGRFNNAFSVRFEVLFV